MFVCSLGKIKTITVKMHIEKSSGDLQKNILLSCIRSPEARDGKDLYNLAKASGGLDVNSEYAYLLLGAHFAQNCAVVEVDDKIVGFVSAYITEQNTLFVWQIAVDKKYQKQGLALKMLKDILSRDSQKQIKYLQATITPNNTASRRLFKSLACDLKASFVEQTMFPKDYFNEPHEEEVLFQIGPFSYK